MMLQILEDGRHKQASNQFSFNFCSLHLQRKKMSSCGACSSGCKCGSGCSCNGCGCCKRNPSLGEEMSTSTQAMILGVAPQKGQLEGFEMAEAENGGCKCGSNCTCDPCNCK